MLKSLTQCLAFPNGSHSLPNRAAFSMPLGMHYFNCAYLAPLSTSVEAAGMRAIRRQRNPVEVLPDDYFAGPDRVRKAFAALVNGEPHRVALVPSVSYAMAIARHNLPISRTQNVVVIGEEFPSAIMPWRRRARERGAALRTVAQPQTPQNRQTAEWNDRLFNAIDRNTAIVVLSQVHWCDGTLFDLEALSRRARDVGAAVVIDATQSLGALPFDVHAVKPDVLVSAGYKWLMGAYGLSVAYFGSRFDDGVPIEETWTSQIGSENFALLTKYRDQYRADAARYDGGQRASFVLVPMLYAALEQLREWRVERIQQYCSELTTRWIERLEKTGASVTPPSDRAAHLFGLRFQDRRDLTTLTAQLAMRDIHVSARGDVLRVSPHVYNDDEDFDALVKALNVLRR